MFDGNHRTRRDINLGGGGSRSSRRAVRGTTTGGGGRNRRSPPSSSSTTTTTTTKTASGIVDKKSQVLESARIQREQRRIVQRRNDAAKLIQRVWRGWRCRKGVAAALERRGKALYESVHHAAAVSMSATTTMPKEEMESRSVLAMRLSPPLLPLLKLDGKKNRTSSVMEAILEYESLLVSNQATPSKAATPEERARYDHTAGRIVRTSLTLLRPLATKKSNYPVTGTISIPQRLIHLVTTLLGNNESTDDVISILNNNNPSSTNGKEQNGLVLLFLCFRDWFWSSQSVGDDEGEEGRDICKELLHLSCQAASSLSSVGGGGSASTKTPSQGAGATESIAILASALFCSRPDFFSPSSGDDGDYWSLEFERCYTYFQTGDKEKKDDHGRGGWHEVLLASLVPTLTSSSLQGKDLVSGAVRDMISGREYILLSNALSLLSSSSFSGSGSSSLIGTVTLVLNHVLTVRPELAILASLVGRGENVRSLLLGDTKVGAASDEILNVVDLTNDDDEDDDDSTDDDDDDEENGAPARLAGLPPAAAASLPTSAARPATVGAASTRGGPRTTYKRSTSSKLTRAQIQTLPKLDRLYQDQYNKVRKETLSLLSKKGINTSEQLTLLTELAMRIGGVGGKGGGECLMLQLGTHLFAPAERETSSLAAAVTEAEQQAKEAYITTLSTILQGCTTLKPRTSARSPMLSKLAFSIHLLDELWTHVLQHQQHRSSTTTTSSSGAESVGYMATSIFCDLFAHTLLALDDVEFLHRYNNDNDVSSSSVIIRAEIVVRHLRTILHELYWVRPVLANDIAIPATAGTTTAKGGNDESATLLKCHRAKLLISGTKLWNSLYERWCRLFRNDDDANAGSGSGGGNNFCEERCWWFPRLVTRERDDDGAVISSSNAARRNMDADDMMMMEDDDEMMDDDDERSVNSPMDVDEEESSSEDEMSQEGGAGAAARRRPSEAAADAENDALATSFRDPKMARILTSIPQALPFDRRVQLFQSLLNADKVKTQDETMAFRRMMMQMRRFEDGGGDGMEDNNEEAEFTGREKVEIRRDALYGDSMAKLNRLGTKLRRKVQVTFINQGGATEAGIDGGGVFKEFLDDLIREAFDPLEDNGGGGGGNGTVRDPTLPPPLFAVSPVQTLYVNVGAAAATSTNATASAAKERQGQRRQQQQDLLSHYEFLGRVLGKAVYECILVEPQFCLPFLNQLLGKQNTLDDLKNMDPEYYKHLTALRDMSSNEIDNLGLTFELTRIGGTTVELIPGGSSIQVTKANVVRYVHQVSHQRLNVDGANQTRAFLRGFRDLIPPSWVRLFSSYELQKIISGDDTVKGIDVSGMKKTMQYSGGYHPSQPIMNWFWEVIEEMTPMQQRKFLKFMTSCSRQPLLGFGALVPVPCVQQVHLREDEDGGGNRGRRLGNGMFGGGGNAGDNVRLPTSSTCMNLLKLPNYGTKKMLKEKLLYAIEAGAGFELS